MACVKQMQVVSYTLKPKSCTSPLCDTSMIYVHLEANIIMVDSDSP